jgi:hypothetical protein
MINRRVARKIRLRRRLVIARENGIMIESATMATPAGVREIGLWSVTDVSDPSRVKDLKESQCRNAKADSEHKPGTGRIGFMFMSICYHEMWRGVSGPAILADR